MRLDGILVVDKPRGPTSSDVVLHVKRLLSLDRVGHTGTLDPMASGVLPLCLGRATRLSSLLTAAEKSYRATIQLGVRTDTGDALGRPTQTRPVPPIERAGLGPLLASFLGERLQTPPMYSAVKVRGERLYELARRGEEVARAARPIRVERFELVLFDPPSLTVEIDCSKGTYVRVLGEELGELLGCGAHLTELRRLRSGRFGISGALEVATLVAATPAEREALVRARLTSMEGAVAGLPKLVLEPALAAGVAQGRCPPPTADLVAGPVALFDQAGELLALARIDGGGKLSLQRVFAR